MAESALSLVETVTGTYFYHLAPVNRKNRALCGARTMPTLQGVDGWGLVTHLGERYCSKCAAHLPQGSRSK